MDDDGNTIDFYLSRMRNTAAVKSFLGKALHGLNDWEKPTVVSTDKALTYAAALAALKQDGRCPEETRHRQSAARPASSSAPSVSARPPWPRQRSFSTSGQIKATGSDNPTINSRLRAPSTTTCNRAFVRIADQARASAAPRSACRTWPIGHLENPLPRRGACLIR